MNDDAVFTRSARLADPQLDPWFFDANQGFGVDAVELSGDQTTRDRDRRAERREAARLPHDDEPVRRAGLGPQAVRAGQPAVAQQCYELPGKFEARAWRRAARAMAYGTGEGVCVARDPRGLRARRAGALRLPPARSRPTGARPMSRPRPSRSSRRRPPHPRA